MKRTLIILALTPLKGDLMRRTDNKRGMTETFGYDEMNRLVQVNNTNITYQDNGNIISKPDVGTLSYDDASHPYRVTSLNASNPSMYTTQQSVSYTCYSRPSRIEDNGLSASFTYNADGERVKMAVAGAIGGAMSSMTYLAANQVASSFNKPNTVETIGVASENIGGYMNDLVLGNSMYVGELNAIYVTASQDYYNIYISLHRVLNSEQFLFITIIKYHSNYERK